MAFPLLLSEARWALVPYRQNSVLTCTPSWRSLQRKCTQTTLSLFPPTHCHCHFFITHHRNFSSLGWRFSFSHHHLELQQDCPQHQIYLQNTKVWKCLNWGNIKAHWAAMGLHEGVYYHWKRVLWNLFTHTYCLASGFIIFQYTILYVPLKWHCLNKCANSQYVFQSIYPLSTIFTAISLGFLEVSVQQIWL